MACSGQEGGARNIGGFLRFVRHVLQMQSGGVAGNRLELVAIHGATGSATAAVTVTQQKRGTAI